MLAVVVLIVSAALSLPAAAQEIHSDLCLYGCPSGSPPSNDLIIRDVFILSSNDMTKFADWVAYRVTKDTIGTTKRRIWRADPWLADDETLEPDDYDGANSALKTDRGHQAPLASFTGTADWEVTNYLSNITPQKSDLNRGAWVKLENAVRTLAKDPTTNMVYVMTGPLFEREMPPMPGANESHRVPSGYWKIIAIQRERHIKVASFLFDQETERRAKFCDEEFVRQVRTIESKTGLDFFPALQTEEQDELEGKPSTLLSDLGCSP